MKNVSVLFLGLILSLNAQAECSEKVQRLLDAGVPADLLNELGKKTSLYVKKSPRDDDGDRTATVVDFSRPANASRFYVINLFTGEIEKYLTSHGKGSGGPSLAVKFANIENSQATALGMYRLSIPSDGSIGVIGLEESNNLSRRRGLGVRGCNHVSEKAKRAGRSFGDFCLDPKVYAKIRRKISATFLYAGKSTGAAVPDLQKNAGLCQLIENLGVVKANAASEVPTDEEVEKLQERGAY